MHKSGKTNKGLVSVAKKTNQRRREEKLRLTPQRKGSIHTNSFTLREGATQAMHQLLDVFFRERTRRQ
jgi:hypothetical protein